MNNFIQFKKKKSKEILEKLKSKKISDINYDSTQEPFFLKKKSTDFEIDFKEIKNLPDGLNYFIKLLFEIIGNPEKEVYLDNWTILSLNKCLENYKHYCENNQFSVFDIAIKYEGMGHVKVLSCDLDTHLLFYRPDGGSNDWERKFNFEKLLKYDGTEYKHFFFKDWFFN